MAKQKSKQIMYLRKITKTTYDHLIAIEKELAQINIIPNPIFRFATA